MKNRIQFDEQGELDEVVTDGGAHLENMGEGAWFLFCERADGSGVAVWIRGKVTDWEEQEPGGFRLLQDRVRAAAEHDSRDAIIAALRAIVEGET